MDCAWPVVNRGGPIRCWQRPTTMCRPPSAAVAWPASSIRSRGSRCRRWTRTADEFGLTEFRMNDPRQGIVHVIGPEQGATLPGMTVVCGDSHTSTHGAFGGAGAGHRHVSEVEHVLATPVSGRRRSCRTCSMRGQRHPAARRDRQGSGAARSSVQDRHRRRHRPCARIQPAARSAPVSMEGRMTICNMAIEAGARTGLVAVDQTTIDYLQGRPYAHRRGRAVARRQWPTGARSSAMPMRRFDACFEFELRPQSSHRSPGGRRRRWCCRSMRRVPDPAAQNDADATVKARRLGRSKYMGLRAGQPISDDCRSTGCSSAPARTRGSRTCAPPQPWSQGLRKVAASVKQALVVPGSGPVKRAAEAEGLDRIFKAAGFEWREPGCSMCLAMNADRLGAGEHCASTSNRNFEGRQGHGGRTHLVSPAMAAAAAIQGRFTDVRHWQYR
jgi:3-isopropylmalate/(R)-2-methylmalate dehydratase large subunit